MSTKNRSRSKEKKASSHHHHRNEAFNRLYAGTTSSKSKERPAFNLDTHITHDDVPHTKASKKVLPDKEDYGRAWTESLRS